MNLGSLNYAAAKPEGAGLVVELTGDGGVRVALVALPALWTRVWTTALPWIIAAIAAGLETLLIWLARRAPAHHLTLQLVVWWTLTTAYSAALMVYWIARAANSGVVVEVAVRGDWVECIFAKPFWRRRKRWRTATIKGFSISREVPNRGWEWLGCLKIRRRGGLSVRAFVGQPREVLEWAASGLQDALTAAETTCGTVVKPTDDHNPPR